jgi:NACHT domain
LLTPQLGIIYFFFNHSDHTQTADRVIRVLLRQILEQLDNIPQEVVSKCNQYIHDPHKRMPDRETYLHLLAFAIEEFFKKNQNPVFILVDAYDELLSTTEKAGRAVAEKKAIRSSLFALAGTNRAKILITTRPHHCQELQSTFPDAKIANVYGDHEDMKIYIKREIQPFDFPTQLEADIITALLKSNFDEKW